MSEKEELFKELKKLAKRANQRILRLERLTGLKEPFATKQLMDYLSVEDAVSKKGRVRVTMKFSENQMVNIIKATKEFLAEETSLVSGVKKLKKQVEKSLDTEITWEIASAGYTANELYDWANETYSSKFWKEFGSKIYVKTKQEWVEYCTNYVGKINDVEIRNKLKALYDILIEKGFDRF